VSSHLTERFVEGEFRDAGRPDGEVVEDKSDGGKAADDDLGAAGTTQLLTLERESNHEVSLDGETDDVPDRQEAGDVRRVDEELAPAWPMIDLPHSREFLRRVQNTRLIFNSDSRTKPQQSAGMPTRYTENFLVEFVRISQVSVLAKE